MFMVITFMKRSALKHFDGTSALIYNKHSMKLPSTLALHKWVKWCRRGLTCPVFMLAATVAAMVRSAEPESCASCSQLPHWLRKPGFLRSSWKYHCPVSWSPFPSVISCQESLKKMCSPSWKMPFSAAESNSAHVRYRPLSQHQMNGSVVPLVL